MFPISLSIGLRFKSYISCSLLARQGCPFRSSCGCSWHYNHNHFYLRTMSIPNTPVGCCFLILAKPVLVLQHNLTCVSHHILSCVSRQNTLPRSMSPTSYDQTVKDKPVAFLFFLFFPPISSYVFHINIELLSLFISFSTYTLCCLAQSSHSQPPGLSLALLHSDLASSTHAFPVYPIVLARLMPFLAQRIPNLLCSCMLCRALGGLNGDF